MGLFNRKRHSDDFTDSYNEYRRNTTITKEDGSYDYTKFSKEEKRTIIDAINEANKTSIPALSLCNIANITVYKPRIILYEIAFIKSSSEDDIIYKLVAGLASIGKGAVYRPYAIPLLKEFIDNASNELISIVNRIYPYQDIMFALTNTLEKEYEFQAAYYYTKKMVDFFPDERLRIAIQLGSLLQKININDCVDFWLTIRDSKKFSNDEREIIETHLRNAKDKQLKGYVYKPRKNRKRKIDEEFDKEIYHGAIQFLELLK